MLSYRTAYLKANYPVEFMAALLSSELGNMDKISKFVEACEGINIKVLGPDVNVSRQMFTPIIDPSWSPSADSDTPFERSAGSIRFGLAAIKGIGDAAANAIVAERDKNGNFSDIFDFLKRVGMKNINRRVVENLILAGGFDSFGIDRGHLLGSLDAILNHAQEMEKDMLAGQTNMFDLLDMGTSQNDSGSGGNIIDTTKAPMSVGEKLRHEKELLSFYVSGHPMAEYAGFDDALDELPNADAVRRVKKLPFRACGVVSNIVKGSLKKTTNRGAILHCRGGRRRKSGR